MSAELVGEEGLPAEGEQVISKVQQLRHYFRFHPYPMFSLLLVAFFVLAAVGGGFKCFGTVTLVSGEAFLTGLTVFRGVFVQQVLARIELDVPLSAEAIHSAMDFTLGVFSQTAVMLAVLGVFFLVIRLVANVVLRKNQPERA